MIRLEITYPDGRVEIFEKHSPVIRIGSGDDVEIPLPGLPPLLAVIRQKDSGLVLKPAENARIIFNNKQMILPKRLSARDRVEFAGYRLKLLEELEEETKQNMPDKQPVGESAGSETKTEPEPKDSPGLGPQELTDSDDMFQESAPTEFLELPPEIVPRLQVTGGPDQGTVFEVLGTAVLGRDPSADFALSDKFVSRHHIKFYLAEDGSVVAEDIGGKNPVLINGRVTPKKVLRHGDVIRVGKTELLFIYEAQGFDDEDDKPTGQPAWKKWLWPVVGAVAGFIILVGVIFGITKMNSDKARANKAQTLLVQAQASVDPGEKAQLYSRAADIFNELSAKHPDDQEIRTGLSVASSNAKLWQHIDQAQKHLEAGRFQEAMTEAQLALEQDPNNPIAANVKDEATSKLFLNNCRNNASQALADQNPYAALLYARMGLDAAPQDPELSSIRDSALVLMEKGISKSTWSSKQLQRLRNTHLKNPDPSATIKIAQSMLAENPQDPGALFYSAVAEMEKQALEAEQKGETEKAREIWARIVKIEPSNPRALRRLK